MLYFMTAAEPRLLFFPPVAFILAEIRLVNEHLFQSYTLTSSPLQWYYFKLLHLPIWGVKKERLSRFSVERGAARTRLC